LAADGHSYEKFAIDRWFEEHPNSLRSPTHNGLMPSRILLPNINLKKSVAEFKATLCSDKALLEAGMLWFMFMIGSSHFADAVFRF